MELYKITICPVNSFCSPLQSDTFFGAFCWSYLHLYGEEKLKKLIQNYKTANPEIIFSNAFFKGFLPAPFSGIIKTGDENVSLSQQEKYQKYIEKKIAELQTASKYLKREEDFLSFIESNKWYEPFTAELEEREFSLAPIRFCHSLNVIENAQKLTDFFCADGDFTIPENPVCCVIPEHVLTSDKFRAHRHNCASDDNALHKRDIFTREKGLYGCIINQGTADGIVSAVNKVLDHVSACGYAISGNAFVINSQNILNITNNQDSIYIIQIQLEKADD